jgi:hypothetical protein
VAPTVIWQLERPSYHAMDIYSTPACPAVPPPIRSWKDPSNDSGEINRPAATVGRDPSVPQRQAAAQPEALPPPREFVAGKDTKRRLKASSAARNDGRDALDVPTLPSRRGQYK